MMQAIRVDDPADLGGLRGAYALVLALPGPLVVRVGRRTATLPAGRYVYGGRAYGPGGLGARLTRHARPDKRRCWHVDQLTATGRIEAMWACPGADECAVVAAALAHPGAAIPLRGFGASDCRACAAHLVRLGEPWRASALISF